MTKLYFGWIPDLPDNRDYNLEHADIISILGNVAPNYSMEVDPYIDLRKWCSPIEDQKNLGSCTAQAAVGMFEYLERRAMGRHIDGSKLFVYKTTRKLLGFRGDTGAFIRSTMGALVLFGVPPEKYWRYNTWQFNREPSAFVYSMGEKFVPEEGKYYRLDYPLGMKRDRLLLTIKQHLAAMLPIMFGFSVYESIRDVDDSGFIPYPKKNEKVIGGHAIMACGYSDNNKALLIRNSWGDKWGDHGYGWLPYEYILNWQALDFWTMISAKWIDTGKFGF